MEKTHVTEDIFPSITDDWRTATDPKQAGWLFAHNLLQNSKDSKTLFLCVDIGKDKVEQDRALVKFYRRDNVQWASPLQCKLKGDVATGSGVDRHMLSTVIFKLRSGFHLSIGSAVVTNIFEGEPDHLIPSDSRELFDNNMFTVAGRMIGHSFLHQGPSVPGLSPAIIHIIFGGSLETIPISLQDCPDLDIRDMVTMLSNDAELKDLEAIHELCLLWNLPAPNATNRKWLSEKLLLHAVIGRIKYQISQLQEGLKHTGVWPLLVHRRDVIPVLFPRESEAEITPEVLKKKMILDCIIWPSSITVILENGIIPEEDDCDAMDIDRVSGYFKCFIENASPAELKSLVKFWTGWEVPAIEMRVEVVDALLPTASTCMEKLRLPRHYTTYDKFRQDLCACISSSHSFFGCE